MKLFSPLVSALTVSAHVPPNLSRRDPPTTTKTIPVQLATGNIIAEFISSAHGLEAPKLSAANSTSYDWWYFHAASPDFQSAVAIVFFTAVNTAFPLLSSSIDVTSSAISYRFPNGTNNIIGGPANIAVVKTKGQGGSGDWNGTGMSWTGKPDLSAFTVEIDNDAFGVKGKLKMESTAPAHYPCGPVRPGQNMQLAPRIGWANAVPDGDGEIYFNIRGSRLRFKGSAYHDMPRLSPLWNWGDRRWYADKVYESWGHARLGPYSIVWFSILSPGGTESVSAYVAKHNRIVTSSCAPTSLVVRPLNAPYPPTIASPKNGDFSIVMDLGDAGVLRANVTRVTTVISGGPAYKRWAGTAVGKIERRRGRREEEDEGIDKVFRERMGMQVGVGF
ncbi:hypothetical protein BJ875DRAFT_377977 [Amylocarpus encephaloides]|uniref:AttH domain-containing protein n=1 Tax=Amylocarpus encephaloides TaxID=45428 RepID=A0A9P7YHS8_9HELO|nr:hypothetical protein BJ875DRAFT_377977 [Amylocarpus encephaloides]